MARAFPQIHFQLIPLFQDAGQGKRRFDGLLDRVQRKAKDPPRAAISTLPVIGSPRGKYRVRAARAFVLAQLSHFEA